MTECSKEEFNAILKIRKTFNGLVGPFTHSAPSGNLFHEEPFKECAWTINDKTSLIKRWNSTTGWTYFKKELCES